MEHKVRITNEEINKKFKNQFELVNYAIKLAENMLKTGRDARIKSDVQNRALQILEEIVTGKDQFDEIPVAAPVEVITRSRGSDREERDYNSDRKRNSSRSQNALVNEERPKRSRKILID